MHGYDGMNETQQAEQVQWSEVTLDSGSMHAYMHFAWENLMKLLYV
jgi:hypothetical protein